MFTRGSKNEIKNIKRLGPFHQEPLELMVGNMPVHHPSILRPKEAS